MWRCWCLVEIFCWCLVEILKMKCDQDLCLNFWYDFKMLLWQDELNPRVRCAFGNVFDMMPWQPQPGLGFLGDLWNIELELWRQAYANVQAERRQARWSTGFCIVMILTTVYQSWDICINIAENKLFVILLLYSKENSLFVITSFSKGYHHQEGQEWEARSIEENIKLKQ